MQSNSKHHNLLGLPKSLTITVCSGSNTAHFAAAYLGSKPAYSVNVLSRNPTAWSNNLTILTSTTSWEQKGPIQGYVEKITDDPSIVIPNSDIVLISAPAHIHKILLQNIAPFLKQGTILGCLFSQGGFDWMAKSVLKEKLECLDGIFGLQNIPWVCKATTYGKVVQLYGAKKRLYLASYPSKNAKHYALIVSLLFDIPTDIIPNFLSLTLTPSNQIIHPARYFSLFRTWDKKSPIPKEKISTKLYGEFDDDSAKWLTLLDQELQAIKNKLLEHSSTLDLSAVLPVAQRIILQYSDDVSDKTSLKSIFRTNKGYAGCITPVTFIDEKTVFPAVKSRLFWEDIPYGLCILKSIAQMVHCETPTIDLIILWHQQLMNKSYLLEDTHQLNKKLTSEMGIPEAYGIFDVQSLLNITL